MKRSIAFLFACSIVSLSTVAQAGDLQSQPDPVGAFDYEAAPATLFIPQEAIPLTPAEMCSYPQGGGDNAGLGCVGGLAEAGDYAPPANAETVLEGVRAALMPYNVRVTTTRPPAFVPYMMLLPGDTANDEATSRTCVGAGIDCDGPQRNDIGLTNGGTMNCMTPDPVQTALIAFGYMSGLENNDNEMDPMFYPPDFANPAVTFVDACSTLVPTLDDMGMDNLPVCVGAYHEVHCDMMDGQINSHLELLGVYGPGPSPEDITPPTVDAIGIENGMVLPAGSELPLTATVTDDGGFVFVRWTIESTNETFLMNDVNEDGVVCKAHNSVCEVEFQGNGVPYFQSDDGDYGAPELAPAGQLGGDFTVTFEAADLAGNAIEPITVMITVEGGSEEGGADTSGSDGNDTNNDTNNDSGNDTSSSEGGGSDDGGATGGTDDEGGCACNSTGDSRGAAFMLLGLVGLGLSRRRARR